ncbi:unnamed protein product [Brachionus calyciflorus]|uniref:Reverse transcriptase domain-containing protein n=1 Tax=Brachionus calyciflorus TaxID=104777 RepID=A0A814FM12_9BILA|nr:unnamed protein product [Brachionus calyciflorus]
MIPKKSSASTNPKDFRPISVTGCLAKLAGNLIQRRLVKFMEENNLLIMQQSGFHKKRQTKDNLIQKSTEQFNRKKKASGYSYTDKVGDNCYFHILHEEHLDEPNMSKIYLLERRRFIKERAANSDDKARKIVSLAEKPYDDPVRVNLPSYSSCRQVIQREQKSKKPEYPKEPETLADIDILDLLKTTLNNESFLFYDSGASEKERFLIFTTKSNLKKIEGNAIYCDGTFSIAPKNFYQVYTVHLMVKNQLFAVIYAFLPRKTQAIHF